MKPIALFGTLATVLCISAGQVLFKVVAGRANAANSLFAPNVLGMLLVALTLYGGATLVWVWVLRQIPLTTAFVFMSLSFVIVPVLAAVFFKEALTARYFLGMALIIAGILVSLTAKAAA